MGKARRAKERAKKQAKRSKKNARKNGKAYLKDSLDVVQAKEAAGGRGLVDDRRPAPKGWRPISSGYSVGDNGSSYDGSGRKDTWGQPTGREITRAGSFGEMMAGKHGGDAAKWDQVGTEVDRRKRERGSRYAGSSGSSQPSYGADPLVQIMTKPDAPEKKMMRTLDGRLIPSNPFFASKTNTDVARYIESLGDRAIVYQDGRDSVVYHPDGFKHEALKHETAILESPVSGLDATLLAGYVPYKDDPDLVVRAVHFDFIESAIAEPKLVKDQLVATLYAEHGIRERDKLRELERQVDRVSYASEGFF